MALHWPSTMPQALQSLAQSHCYSYFDFYRRRNWIRYVGVYTALWIVDTDWCCPG
jgi:hypothetical protein